MLLPRCTAALIWRCTSALVLPVWSMALLVMRGLPATAAG